jgi:ribosomal protein S2
MPLHRFTHVDARQEVERLEEAGEIVTAISSDDSGVYISTTKDKPAKAARKPAGEKETRA